MTSTTLPAFASIRGVHAKTAATLEKLGFATAFPVQAAVIPSGVRGRDMLVQAPTGSGKTLAFGIPIVEQLATGARQPGALVLVPTRELAVQVRDDLEAVARGKQLKCVAVFGGAAIDHQARQARSAAIVVATPGRLDDMIRNRRIDLRQVKLLVLDEADRMLDMGFQPQVDEILRHVPPKRQTLLFSATLEGAVAQLAREYTTDPEVVHTERQSGGDKKTDHVIMATTTGTKVDTMLDALADERDLAVVFVRTQMGADRVNAHLREHGIRSTAIHGGMNQGQRTREYKRFQEGACDVLVATDVFARGMDLDRITLVLNYDLPEDADAYRHRTGRTGRAGRSGTAITLVLPKQRQQVKRMLAQCGLPQDLVDSMRQPSGKRWKTVPVSERPVDRPNRNDRDDRGRPQRSSERSGSVGSRARGKVRVDTLPHPATGGEGDGVVVSFDPVKGFGFITPDGGGPDVFFHHKVITGGNPASMRNGVRVSFHTEQHERGHRAAQVRMVSGWHASSARSGPQGRPKTHGASSPRHGRKPASGERRAAQSAPAAGRPAAAKGKASGKPSREPSAKSPAKSSAKSRPKGKPAPRSSKPKQVPRVGPEGPNRAARRAHLQRQA